MTNKLIHTPRASIMLVDGGKDCQVVHLIGGDGKLSVRVYRSNDKLVWADYADKYYYMGNTTELTKEQMKDIVGYDKESDMYYGIRGSQCTRIYSEPIDALNALIKFNGFNPMKPYVCLLLK